MRTPIDTPPRRRQSTCVCFYISVLPRLLGLHSFVYSCFVAYSRVLCQLKFKKWYIYTTLQLIIIIIIIIINVCMYVCIYEGNRGWVVCICYYMYVMCIACWCVFVTIGCMYVRTGLICMYVCS
eukprot:Rmarinus@m.13214